MVNVETATSKWRKKDATFNCRRHSRVRQQQSIFVPQTSCSQRAYAKALSLSICLIVFVGSSANVLIHSCLRVCLRDKALSIVNQLEYKGKLAPNNYDAYYSFQLSSPVNLMKRRLCHLRRCSCSNTRLLALMPTLGRPECAHENRKWTKWGDDMGLGRIRAGTYLVAIYDLPNSYRSFH